MTVEIPDKPGGLNGSTHHLLEVFFQESTRLISFTSVDSNGTLYCLGFDGELPYRSIHHGKYCQINSLDGLASTY